VKSQGRAYEKRESSSGCDSRLAGKARSGKRGEKYIDGEGVERYAKGGDSVEVARARAVAWYKNNLKKARAYRSTQGAAWARDGRYCVVAARCRAKKKGIPFDIDHDYVMSLWPKDGVDFFGVKMEWKVERDRRMISRPNAPSLDRIDTAKGYVRGNVMWLSHKMNQLKGGLSLAEWQRLFIYLGYSISGGDAHAEGTNRLPLRDQENADGREPGAIPTTRSTDAPTQ